MNLGHIIHAAIAAGKKLEKPFAAYGRTFQNHPGRTPPFVAPMSPTPDQVQAELPGVLSADPKDVGYSEADAMGAPDPMSMMSASPVPEESVSAGPASGSGIPVMGDTSTSEPFHNPGMAGPLSLGKKSAPADAAPSINDFHPQAGTVSGGLPTSSALLAFMLQRAMQGHQGGPGAIPDPNSVSLPPRTNPTMGAAAADFNRFNK